MSIANIILDNPIKTPSPENSNRTIAIYRIIADTPNFRPYKKIILARRFFKKKTLSKIRLVRKKLSPTSIVPNKVPLRKSSCNNDTPITSRILTIISILPISFKGANAAVETAFSPEFGDSVESEIVFFFSYYYF